VDIFNYIEKEFAAKEKLEIVLFASAFGRGGRKGGLGGIPPAEPIVRNFGSDIFKQTPHINSKPRLLRGFELI